MLTLLCWATPSHPSNLAFYPFPSRITQDISAAIQLISSSKLPLPVIYISQSPSASFPLLWSHLSSAQNTNTGCGLKILTQVFRKYRAKHSKAQTQQSPVMVWLGIFICYFLPLLLLKQTAGIYRSRLYYNKLFELVRDNGVSAHKSIASKI